MSDRHSTEGLLWDQPVLSLQSLLGAVLRNHHQIVMAMRSIMFIKTLGFPFFSSYSLSASRNRFF